MATSSNVMVPDTLSANECTAIDDVSCLLEQANKLLDAVCDYHHDVGGGLDAQIQGVQRLICIARDRLPRGS